MAELFQYTDHASHDWEDVPEARQSQSRLSSGEPSDY